MPHAWWLVVCNLQQVQSTSEFRRFINSNNQRSTEVSVNCPKPRWWIHVLPLELNLEEFYFWPLGCLRKIWSCRTSMQIKMRLLEMPIDMSSFFFPPSFDYSYLYSYESLYILNIIKLTNRGKHKVARGCQLVSTVLDTIHLLIELVVITICCLSIHSFCKTYKSMALNPDYM